MKKTGVILDNVECEHFKGSEGSCKISQEVFKKIFFNFIFLYFLVKLL